VNSSSNDGGSSISLDGLSLFFTSNRPGGRGDHDLYVATRATTNDGFGTPVNLGAGVNSSSGETGPDISADGLTLLFQTYRPGAFGVGQPDNIYMATRANTSLPFGAVVNLGPTINFGGNVGQPGLSADGLSLFFVGDRAGHSDGDIWVSTRASLNGPWGDPVDLGSTVNSPVQDDFVDIARDGLSIVFASARSGSFHMYEAAVVPEPSSLWMLAAAGLPALRRRRR
jgi:Tol biopolymer transport system component